MHSSALGARLLLQGRLAALSAGRLSRHSQARFLHRGVRADGVAKGLARPKPAGGSAPRRHLTRFFVDGRLKRLEDAANANRSDARAELRFVKELGQHYPEAVVRRFESGRYAVNEAIAKEYLKALAHTGKMDAAPLEQILARAGVRTAARAEGGAAAASAERSSLDAALEAGLSSATSAAGSPGSSLSSTFRADAGSWGARIGGSNPAMAGTARSAGPLAGGTPEAPVHVSMVEAGWKTQVWRTVRLVAVAFVLMSAFGALMDDKGFSSRLGLSSAVHTAETSDKRFSDVVGMDEAKGELEEVVMYLKNPERFTRLGGKLPKGLLLMGPPGTGKTLLARAIAGEAGVPFFYASGSEFEEMYVGVGARRVRDLFEVAKKRSPCIIFIDEIDAVGGSRQLKDQAAMKMTLNQLLVEMDGFEQNAGVIVIGATNYAEALDDALMRPGRFDRHVAVPLPDVAGRKAILELYTGRIPTAGDVDVEVLARGTPGMSGAELSNLVNQAALKAAVDGLSGVDMAAFEFAKDKILMGSERRSAAISPETARMTAYHEGGHALVALMTPGADPIHKATIMPRGQALGMVTQLPEGDQTSMSRRQMVARLDVCMGGRVAEEIIFGEDEVTSGASSDLRQATRLARAMVAQWGFSDEIGVVFHEQGPNQTIKPSTSTQDKIDAEVKRLLVDSYNRAKSVLVTHRRELDRLAKALIEHETLTGKEVLDLVKKNKQPKKKLLAPRKAGAPPRKSPARGVGIKAGATAREGSARD